MMQAQGISERLIELRVADRSFDRIAAELKVSMPTLIQWSVCIGVQPWSKTNLTGTFLVYSGPFWYSLSTGSTGFCGPGRLQLACLKSPEVS
jgi:hypothetical protein